MPSRGRVAALEVVAKQRERRQAERAEKVAAARTRKEELVGEAETLAAGKNWRAGADRLRALLDEWKSLPRLDKAADDALWRRFSSARTTYTRHRKAHFAELDEKREGARAVKERLVTEAEAFRAPPSGDRPRVPTGSSCAAGRRPGRPRKGVDDELWRRFRGGAGHLLRARDAATAATDAEFAENARKKESLLVKARRWCRSRTWQAAKSAFRDLADRWDAAGKVPRDRIKELEGRMRAVEQAIRGVEDEAWRRSNPEARARAADTVAQLEASIADLEAKRDKAGPQATTEGREHAAALEARGRG